MLMIDTRMERITILALSCYACIDVALCCGASFKMASVCVCVGGGVLV